MGTRCYAESPKIFRRATVMNAILEFNVSNQIITRVDDFKVVADSRNYLHAHFNFLTDEWENGTATAIFRNNGEAYNAILDQTNTCLVPHEVLDTEDRYVFVSVFCGDRVTANMAKVFVADSGWSDDMEASEPPTPSVYAQIIERMDDIEDAVEQATERTEEAADKAEAAVSHYPRIIDNYWYVWDTENEEFVNTNIRAEAQDGTSATVEIEPINKGHKVIITDANGRHEFDVPDGYDGKGIASISKTGSSGDVDTYTITFTDGDTFAYYVTNGISVTITSRSISGGHRLTITDKNGTSTVDVMDGAKGDTGVGIHSIAKSAEYQNIDYYTITYTNGSKTTFSVTNAVSPTLAVTEYTGGHTITITDVNGTRSFNVPDGNVGTLPIHICTASEYDPTTRVPTIQNPTSDTFYLVPAEDGTSPDMFTEWVYTNNAWEMFGSARVDLSNYVQQSVIAEEYDSTYVYYAGAYCIYDGKFYKCLEDILTPETFDPSKWEEATVGYELDCHQTSINDLAGNFVNVYSNLADLYDATVAYSVGDYCFYQGNIYRCTTAITTPEEFNYGHWELATIGDELGAKITTPTTAGTQGQVLTSDGQGGQSWEDATGGVSDVQMEGVSVVNNGVANIPAATTTSAGVVQVGAGLAVDGNSDVVYVRPALFPEIKAGTARYAPITPEHQHESAFYGLATAAGDATQKSSSNAVGNYTDDAKEAIHEMLGIVVDDELDSQSTNPVQNKVINSALNGLVPKQVTDSETGATAKINNFGAQLRLSYRNSQGGSDIYLEDNYLLFYAENGNDTNTMSFDADGTTIHNVVTPTSAGDAVPKSYVDNNVGSKADITDLAPAYSTSGTYAVGDYVTYNGNVYRCTTAITTAEAWNASHWELTNVGDEMSDVIDDLSELSQTVGGILVEQTIGDEATLTNLYNTEAYRYRLGGNGFYSPSTLIDGVIKLINDGNLTEPSPYIYNGSFGVGTWLVGFKFKFTKLDENIADPEQFRIHMGASTITDFAPVWDEWINYANVATIDLTRIRVAARNFPSIPAADTFSLEIKDLYVYNVANISADLQTLIISQQNADYQDGTVTYGEIITTNLPDRTLSINGKAADAKAVGDALKTLNGVKNAKDYGITGDGTTDDTDAINALFALGGTFYFPSGTYKITGTIELPENSVLYGDGDTTVIDMHDCVNLTACTFRGNDKVYPYILARHDGVSIRDIKLIGNNTLKQQRHAGIGILDSENCSVEDVTIYNINYDPTQDTDATVSGYGICVTRSNYIAVERCHVQQCGYECIGIVDDCNYCVVKDCYTQDGWRTCIQVHRGSCNTTIQNCYMKQTHPKYDACFTVHGLSGDDLVKNLRIVNCTAECTQDGAQPNNYCAPYQIMSYSECLVFMGNRAMGGKRAFFVDGSSTNAKIIGNDFQCNDQSDYGVTIQSLQSIVVGNSLVNDAETANVISNTPILIGNIGIS